MGHSLMKLTLLGGKGGRQRIKSPGGSYLVRGLSCYKKEQLIYGKDGLRGLGLCSVSMLMTHYLSHIFVSRTVRGLGMAESRLLTERMGPYKKCLEIISGK